MKFVLLNTPWRLLVILSFFLVECKKTELVSSCTDVKGSFERIKGQDYNLMTVTQTDCDISGGFNNNFYEHSFKGKWNPQIGAFDVTINRTVRATKCQTVIPGAIYKLVDKNIRLDLNGSDGKCDLGATYTESTVWTNKNP